MKHICLHSNAYYFIISQFIALLWPHERYCTFQQDWAKATVTMDASSDKNVFRQVLPKSLSEQRRLYCVRFLIFWSSVHVCHPESPAIFRSYFKFLLKFDWLFFYLSKILQIFGLISTFFRKLLRNSFEIFIKFLQMYRKYCCDVSTFSYPKYGKTFPSFYENLLQTSFLSFI